MGDFTLGCLLGQYDTAQSFEPAGGINSASNVNSWHAPNGGAWIAQSPTYVHSSAVGANLDIDSYGTQNNLVWYRYGVADDAHRRWFPDVALHELRADLWATMFNAVQSGDQTFRLRGNGPSGGVDHPIPYGNGRLAPLRLHSEVSSSASAVYPGAQFMRTVAGSGHSDSHVDDVLMQVDWITLHPEYAFQEQARVIKAEHRTQGGALHTYLWSKHRAYDLPLRYLPTSHADLINWWWENQFNLVFTLDTSDSESLCVCRIVNERQPIHRRIRPYADLWEGGLLLESLDRGSLVF